MSKRAYAKKYYEKKKFFILSPPPNVTGSLHIGHAFTFTIQDFIVRSYRNLLNYDAFLLLGFDHGGLSTEKSASDKSSSKTLSLDKKTRFKEIEIFANEAKNNIFNQFQKLRLLFKKENIKYTMDSDHTNLVQTTFIKLYEKGLIFRRKGLVNFDTALKTPISDLEIVRKTIHSKIYKIPYILENNEIIEVCTTRPETIFADMFLAINPEDSNLAHLIGKSVTIPLTNKIIPILFHSSVLKDFGTGILKITPAHSVTDYRIWEDLKEKNNLNNIINVIHENNTIDLNSMKEYIEQEIFEKIHNLPVKKAREEVIKILREKQFKIEEKPITQQIPIGDKSGAIIENLMMDQWFFDVSNVANSALKNIDKIKIYPNLWFNTYKNWLEKINPLWCISRSLTWGHQIPAYFKNGEVKVQIENPGEGWIASEEVLDTWFSSALWPLCYKNSFDLFPCNVLVTAHDIIFFWVARMVMMTLEVENTIPFPAVYLHRLVTDKEGQKMSKTKNNGINPIEIIDQYGVNVLRLCLLKSLSPCGKVFLDENSLEEARCILTKLENFGKYLDYQLVDNQYHDQDHDSNEDIIGALYLSLRNLEDNLIRNLENYDLHLMVQDIISFLYETCSWFLEFSKVRKEILGDLRIVYNRIRFIFVSICPDLLDENIEIEKIEIQEYKDCKNIDRLKDLISKVRFFQKINIEIIIDGPKSFSDIIYFMTNVKFLEESGIDLNRNSNRVQIDEYTLYLNNINIVLLEKKIENISLEIDNINKFLLKTNSQTPKKILEDKIEKKSYLEKELEELKRVVEN